MMAFFGEFWRAERLRRRAIVQRCAEEASVTTRGRDRARPSRSVQKKTTILNAGNLFVTSLACVTTRSRKPTHPFHKLTSCRPPRKSWRAELCDAYKQTGSRELALPFRLRKIYGTAWPLFALTSAASLAVSVPLTFTSERKFVAPTVWPSRALV